MPMPTLSKTMRHLLRLSLLLAPLLLSQPRPVAAERAQEYLVKGAMVINMAKYVEWPQSAFAGGAGELVICSVGRGPFAQALEHYRGKAVLGHPVAVRHLQTGDDVGECHMLVVSGIEKRYLAGILEQARRKSVLTVGDIPDFARLGGIVGLVEEGGRVRFEVNMKAAHQARVKISSQLLKLARIIREGEP